MQINEFNQSYVIVKGHIHHVQQKMHTMIEQVPIATSFPYLQQVLSVCPPHPAQQTASTTDALCAGCVAADRQPRRSDCLRAQAVDEIEKGPGRMSVAQRSKKYHAVLKQVPPPCSFGEPKPPRPFPDAAPTGGACGTHSCALRP